MKRFSDFENLFSGEVTASLIKETMTVTVSWYDETHRAIVQRYEGKWTWEELSQAAQSVREMAMTVPHTVILLIDISESQNMPSGNALSQGRAAFNAMPNNMAQIIVAMRSQMMEVFGELVIKMLPQWRNRVKFTKTFEVAEKLTQEAIAKNTPAS